MGNLLLLAGTWFFVRSVITLWHVLLRRPQTPPSSRVEEL